MKSFNVNCNVRVKLTEFGKQMLEQDHNKFWGSGGIFHETRGILHNYPYTPPDEDEDGYVKFQLWILMDKLGKYCILGCEPPFDTVILIDEKDLRDV